MKNQPKPKVAVKATKVVVKPDSKTMPAKVAVKTTKTVVQPKPKMTKAPRSNQNKLDSLGKRSIALAEAGLKKARNRDFSGMDKDFKKSNNTLDSQRTELKRYDIELKKYLNRKPRNK